jgi:hypothetical protein
MQPQRRSGLRQGRHRVSKLQGHRPVLFGQLLPVAPQHQRRVQVGRCGQAQSVLQQDLPGRVVAQVLATHDMGHALCGVVNHHGQLVGPQAVGALDHEVAHRRRQGLLLRAQQAVLPSDHIEGGIGHLHAPGAALAALQTTLRGPAGAGVDQIPMAGLDAAQRGVGRGDVGPGAGAGVGLARCGQVVQRLLVQRATLALQHRRLVGQQATGGQLLQDQFGGAGHTARRVHVFDAHQPAAAVCAGVQPAGERRDQ